MKPEIIKYIPETSILHIENMWTSQFVGRKLIDKHCIDSSNRLEIYSEKYFRYLEIDIDDEGFIKNITPNKISDNSCPFGKPFTRSLKFAKADINASVKVLSEKITPRVTEKDLEETVTKYSLNGGKYKLKLNKSSLSYSNGNNNYSIPRRILYEYLEISYSYLDIICNSDFWDVNEYLNSNYKDIIQELFSVVDTSKYPNYCILQEEAAKRKYLAEAIPKYRMLCDAIKENKPDINKDLIDFCSLEVFGDKLNAVEIAIEQKNNNLIKQLIKANAFVSDTALIKAIENCSNKTLKSLIELKGDLAGDTKISSLIADTHNYDSLVDVVSRGANYCCSSDLPIDYLIKFSEFENVDYSEAAIFKLFEENEYETIKRIIERNTKNHHEKAFDASRVSIYGSLNYALIRKAILDKNIEMAKEIVDYFYTPMSIEFALFMIKKSNYSDLESRIFTANILTYALANNSLRLSQNNNSSSIKEFIEKYTE